MPKIAATPIIRWKCADHEISVVEEKSSDVWPSTSPRDAAGDEQRNEADARTASAL